MAITLAGNAAAGVWEPVGPAGVVLRALAIDPVSPGRMYVGTNSAGVYRSEDGGVTWFARSIGIGNPSIRALAIDPTSPLTLYAGGSGGGFFRSANGGDSWSQQNADLPPSDVSAIVVDLTDPQVVYAGLNGGGVWKGKWSSDEGKITWASANVGLTATGAKNIRALVMHPTDSRVLYAATGSAGVFRSDDRGASWEPASGGLPAGASLRVFALAIDPASPTTLYAGTRGGLYASDDEGGTWRLLRADLNVRAIVVATDNRDTLYVGTERDGVWRSTDRGVIWNPRNTELTNRNIRALLARPGTPATLYVASAGGGMFRSLDASAKWAAVGSGLPGLDVDTLLVDGRNPQRVFAGTNGGGLFRSTTGGDAWEDVSEGLVSLDGDLGGAGWQHAIGRLRRHRRGRPLQGLGCGRRVECGEHGAGRPAGTVGRSASHEPRGDLRCHRCVGRPTQRRRGANLGTDRGGSRTGPGAVAGGRSRGPRRRLRRNGRAGVYKSDHWGDAWLPRGPTGTKVASVLLNPLVPGFFYVATEQGVYRTTDDGGFWIGVGLHEHDLSALAIDRPLPTRILPAALQPGCSRATTAATAGQ